MTISQSSQSINVTLAQDNIFADLGFSEDEAVNLKIRADLMLTLRSFIKAKGWTQKDAASFFDETQPRISCLMNGDIKRFSVDKLLLMLSKAGMEVKFEVVSNSMEDVEI
ncbi:helix-turn-helix domain-containing protein [Cyanothece sp. BG0011]|uniref:helix-turn-helix domain-containing protein n=1 Tax=Cyanothece sp. BG0011 TaxID=2082950 RepID=UPI000D1ECDAA|nr:helix-turn-helix transcriptional regulator [Cyanothece sp. BG0011]